MKLPTGHSELVQIVNAALVEATRTAGPWLACKSGRMQCCYGAFAINALDAARLKLGMRALQVEDPRKAEALERRAQAWIAEHGPEFPGDLESGTLGTSEEEQARFQEFADEAACPALDPETGHCNIYEWRPMTCRV